MRTKSKILAGAVVVAAAGWFVGCNGTIDDEPNVVLEVGVVSIPPITVTRTAGICTYTITNSSATFNNKPKNSLAGTSPFNDIKLERLLVSYAWDGGGGTLADQPFGIGGTIPANGTQAASFSVINNFALTGIPARDGHSAILAMTFRGTTVAGEPVSVQTGGSLSVNSCTVQAFGACCTDPGNSAACTDTDQTTCQQIVGAAFQGNNTVCATTVCN